MGNFAFGKSSLKHLDTCHQDLVKVARRALEISTVDFSVTCGHRCKEDQDRAVAEKKSKTPWPTSKHNANPARALDFLPINPATEKGDWNYIEGFKTVARAFLTAADDLGVPMRWGGDWNMNGRTDDEKFVDMPHVELR